jgi:Bacterial SH3 domain
MVRRPSPAAPARSADSARPGFVRISLIAVACFAVGMTWPLLAGLEFVQRPPGSNPAKVEDPEPPPLDSEPDSKPSAPPPPRPGAPVNRDEGVRAAAHVAPLELATKSKPKARQDTADAPRSEDEPDADDKLVTMSGQATIGWKAVVVRESPSGQAATLDRLKNGSRVMVTGRKGDWYRVKYGRPSRAGWVHRQALGL